MFNVQLHIYIYNIHTLFVIVDANIFIYIYININININHVCVFLSNVPFDLLVIGYDGTLLRMGSAPTTMRDIPQQVDVQSCNDPHYLDTDPVTCIGSPWEWRLTNLSNCHDHKAVGTVTVSGGIKPPWGWETTKLWERNQPICAWYVWPNAKSIGIPTCPPESWNFPWLLCWSTQKATTQNQSFYRLNQLFPK